MAYHIMVLPNQLPVPKNKWQHIVNKTENFSIQSVNSATLMRNIAIFFKTLNMKLIKVFCLYYRVTDRVDTVYNPSLTSESDIPDLQLKASKTNKEGKFL